jgi:DNA repair protein RadC
MHKVNRYILTYKKGPKFESVDLYDPTLSREFCLELLSFIPVEKLLIIALNSEKKLIGYEYFTGTPIECSIYTQCVFRFLLSMAADSFILAHNHPYGNVDSSAGDRGMRDIYKIIGKSLDIPLVDCMIVAGDKCRSMMRDKN